MGTTMPVTKAEADDINHNTVPLKSCGTPKRFVGRTAIRNLLDIIGGDTSATAIQIEPELVIREPA